MMIDLIFNFLMMIGVAMMTIEFVDSTLTTSIKRFLGMDEEKNWHRAFSNINTYYRVLPKWCWFTVIIPLFILVLIFLTVLLRIIISLVNCPICSGFWIFLAFTFFYLGYPLVTALALTGVGLLLIRLIDRYVTFK